MCVPHFLYWSISGHLGCFYVWAIVSNAVINVKVWISLLDASVMSFLYVPRSGVCGSYGSSICNFLRNLYTVFHSGCSDLYSHRFPFFKKKGNKECYPSHVQLQFYQCSLQAWLFSPTPLYKGLRCRDFSHSVWAGVSAAHVLFLTVKSWACANSSCLLGRCWEPKKASSLFVSEDLGAVDTKRISALG